MRITDDRYTRDRLRLDLALRLIGHEARTRTIRSWTGLTEDRIRKLFRSYVEHAGLGSVRRHRGKSPRQPAFFLKNGTIRLEASSLASCFCQLGLLDAAPQPPLGAVGLLRWGESFCEAYEAFLYHHPAPQIGFEHACFLRQALERRRELCIDDCRTCGSLLVVSAYAGRPEECVLCAGPGRRAPHN